MEIFSALSRFLINRQNLNRSLLVSIFFFLFAFHCSFAQSSKRTIILKDSINLSLKLQERIKKINTESTKDDLSQKLLFYLYSEGYLTARIDSIKYETIPSKYYLTAGEIYKWAFLKPGNVEEEVLNLVGYSNRNYQETPVSIDRLENLLGKILTHYENSGYPFASIKLDSINITHNSLSASINLSKEVQIKVDSILIHGSNKINPTFIYNYIGLTPGDLYNESKIKKIKTRLKELSFVHETKPASLTFSKEATKLHLYIEDKKASQFNGILGVLPDNKDPQKILLTGDAFVKLQNSFGRGELIEVNWKKLQTLTQDMKTHLVYPFFLNTPFGIDYKLNIYKRDTSFLNVNNIAGVQYWLNGGNYLKAYINIKKSSLLSTKGLENISKLPDNSDVKAYHYGLEYRKENLDYKFNPRKGYSVTINGSVGTRTIIKNPKLNDIIYNNINLKTTQYNTEANFELYIPIYKKGVLKLGSSSAILHGNQIFNNELYRIGGLKTLRGFDEESIFASAYSVLNIECRYLLEQHSYIHAFWNGAWYENNSVNLYIRDIPYGFGAGISFESKPGIFSISYALGKQFENPILFRAGKVHFGFVSYF